MRRERVVVPVLVAIAAWTVAGALVADPGTPRALKGGISHLHLRGEHRNAPGSIAGVQNRAQLSQLPASHVEIANTTEPSPLAFTPWMNISSEHMGAFSIPCIGDRAMLGADGAIIPTPPSEEEEAAGAGRAPARRFPMPMLVDFSVLSWNVFGRPLMAFSDAQLERLQRLNETIFARVPEDDLDVVLLQEVTDEETRRVVLESFAALPSGWHYVTKPLAKPSLSLRVPGGLVALSKWPIEREEQLFFTCVSLPNVLSQAGSIYTRIVKMQNGRPKRFHVFVTHLQSSAGITMAEKLVEVQTRQCQMRELRVFMDSLDLPRNEPVIVAGDFNVDLLDHTPPFADEIQTLGKVIGVDVPAIGGPFFATYDSRRNELVGRDGSAEQYGCGAECDLLGNCTCVPPMWLDYVTVSLEHQRPVNQSALYVVDARMAPLEVTMAQSSDPRIASRPVQRVLTHLSDHDPVVRLFKFLL